MSVIATLAVPAEDFALGAALSANPGIRVRLERVVPIGGTFVPYLWAANESVEEIETELRTSTETASVDVVDTADDEALVRIEWATDTNGFLAALAESEATILEGVGEAGAWRFQLRFDDHERLTDFYRACADHGISVDLERVHNPGTPRVPGGAVDLTDPQRETLRLALERGYFDVPRRINLVELAEEIGLSDSAVSQRLRRGTATLLATVLADADADAENGGTPDE